MNKTKRNKTYAVLAAIFAAAGSPFVAYMLKVMYAYVLLGNTSNPDRFVAATMISMVFTFAFALSFAAFVRED